MGRDWDKSQAIVRPDQLRRARRWQDIVPDEEFRRTYKIEKDRQRVVEDELGRKRKGRG